MCISAQAFWMNGLSDFVACHFHFCEPIGDESKAQASQDIIKNGFRRKQKLAAWDKRIPKRKTLSTYSLFQYKMSLKEGLISNAR